MSKQPGLNLADIAPMHEDVPFGESFIRVHGISAKTGLEIIKRFPKILGMVSGDKFNLGAFLSVAPDAVAAIIAAAAGQLGNEQAETNAGALAIEAQLELMEAIGRVTFTKGFGPFVAKIMVLASGATSNLSGKVPDLTSQPPLKPSSPPDTPPL